MEIHRNDRHSEEKPEQRIKLATHHSLHHRTLAIQPRFVLLDLPLLRSTPNMQDFVPALCVFYNFRSLYLYSVDSLCNYKVVNLDQPRPCHTTPTPVYLSRRLGHLLIAYNITSLSTHPYNTDMDKQ
jgi:hypothetical protein